MSNKSKHNSSILLEVIISIIFFSNLNSYNAINLLLAESRITIKLKSSGKQNIINYDLIRVGGQYPDEIHIKNGATYRIMNYTSYIINLQPNENTLIMVWNIYTANNTRNMFRGCINITEINLTEFNIDSKILSTGMMFYNCISLTSVIFGKFGGPDLRWIDQLFSYCSSLVYVDLSNFDTSGVTMMNFVFKGCSNLKSINLSNFDTSKVQNMSYMFADCYSLESLNLSNFITSNVKDMSRMFLNCKNLTNINLSGFDTSNLIYMPSLFFGCINLTYINISNFNTSQLRGIDSSFKNCSSLISVDLPIFKSVLYADNMFAGCVSLTSLNLKNLYIDNVNKPIHMFEDCYKLKYINLENFKENNKINNDTTKDMFKNIPENVVICINETINPIISGLIKEIKCSTIFCGDNWLEKQKVIGQNGQCKERCDNDSEFLYDGKCYNDCLKGDYNNINIIERNCKCPLDLDLYKYCPSAPEGYYLNKSDLYYKSCYISCEKCDIGGEENNHNCIECKQNYSYEMNLNDYKNCYDICPYYFYYDKNSSNNSSLIVSVDYGDVLGSGLQDNIEGDADDGSFKIYWSGTTKNTGNGILFYVNFNVASTASGKTTVELNYSQQDTFDENYDDVILDCHDAEITIVNNHYSNYAKITASTNDVAAGDNCSVALNLSELKALSAMQLTLSYQAEIFEFVSADSAANIVCENNNGNIALKISNITSAMNHTAFVTVTFKSKEQAISKDYSFELSAATEGVFCKGCTITVKPSASREAAVLYADEVTAKQNDIVTVPVKISNNHGIMGYMLHFEYNPSELEIISVTSNAAFVGNFENNIGNKIGEFDVLWTGSGAISENGTVLILKFKVITDREVMTSIAMRYSQEDTFDEEYNDVILDCKAITVKLNPTQSAGETGIIEPTTAKPATTEPGTAEPIKPSEDNEENKETAAPIKTVKLKTTKYVYNGKVRTPAVIVKDANGKTVSSKYYTVKYAKGRKKVGRYSVKITFKGKYSGTKKQYFTIVPKTTAISTLTATKKSIKVKWKQRTKQVSGYQIQYATSKSFKSKKTITIKNYKTTVKSIKKLKRNKKYYFRIRTYKVVNGKKYYSKWSKIKSIKTK